MKHTKLKYLILMLMLFFYITSCKKEDEKCICIQSNYSLNVVSGEMELKDEGDIPCPEDIVPGHTIYDYGDLLLTSSETRMICE